MLVELAVEKLVDHVICGRDTNCGEDAQDKGLDKVFGPNAAQHVGEDDAWNNENVLRAVIKPRNRKIILETRGFSRFKFSSAFRRH